MGYFKKLSWLSCKSKLLKFTIYVVKWPQENFQSLTSEMRIRNPISISCFGSHQCSDGAESDYDLVGLKRMHAVLTGSVWYHIFLSLLPSLSDAYWQEKLLAEMLKKNFSKGQVFPRCVPTGGQLFHERTIFFPVLPLYITFILHDFFSCQPFFLPILPLYMTV